MALMETGTCSICEIAAITFTRKAAAELRQRIQNELERAYRKERDAVIIRRLDTALSNLHQCFIGTIHAFCTRLLMERPVEAGLDGDFAVVEDTEDLQQEAWDRYLLQVRGRTPGIIQDLEEKGFSLATLRKAYETILTYRDVSFPTTPLIRPDFQPVLEKLRALVAEGYREIPSTPKEGRYDSLQEKIRRAHRFYRYRSLETDEQRLALLLIFDKEQFSIIQKLWNSKEKAKEFRERFKLFQKENIKPVLKEWREYCYPLVMEFLLPAVDVFQSLKQEQGLMDFQDLLMKTAWLLRENGEVRGYFQNKYPRVFVDEFQDTDPIQSEVMLFLCSDSLEERDWQKITVRPGSLFVVGDPKQSIYRFRRADLDVYTYVKEKMQESGAKVVRLTTNFRSVHSLGTFCNTVFKDIFPSTPNQYQALYDAMNTLKKDSPPSGVRVLTISQDYKKNAEVITEEARIIATHVRSLIDAGVFLPKDFLVLLRYKMNLTVYAKAFENAGIPVRMTGGNSLAGNREIQELFSLCQVLANPHDGVALVSVLRGSFFGFHDGELFAFKRAGGSFHLFAPIPEGLPAAVADVFSAAYSRLKQYYRWTETLSPAAAFQEIITSLGLVPYFLTGDFGESRCGHLLQLIEWIRQLEHQHLYDWISLVKELEELLIRAPEEELGMDSTYENALRLMNLHKAKGLEAEVVFLADPVKGGPKGADCHVQRTSGEACGYLQICNDRGVDLAWPKNWHMHQREEEKYLQAEEMRLLYVAATRAKQLLIISRSLYPANEKKNPWQQLLKDAPFESLTTERGSLAERCNKTQNMVLAQNDFAQVVRALSAPTYGKLLPSATQTTTGAKITVEGEGGVDWGHAVHSVLEAFVKGETNLETVMEQALFHYGLAKERKTELEGVLTRFQEKLGLRIKRAERALTEVPFSLLLTPKDPLRRLFQENETVNGPILLTGVMDLALQEEDGWSIVDYKADRVKKKEDLQVLAKRYENQIILYGRAWEAITGEKVQACFLYFLYSNQLVKMKG